MRVMPNEAAQVELAMSDVRTYLDEAAGPLREQGISVETTTRFGNPATEIIRSAREYAADLLVMSTHGRSGPGRWLYGSVADEVLRHADVPVVLLSPDARTELPAERPARILVPLDGSQLGEATLAPARDWAARLGAELILLQVVFWPPLIYGDGAELMMLDPEEDLRIAQEYVDDVAKRWRSDATPIRTRTMLGRPVPTAIAQVAAQEQVDLVAMATHGRSGVARVVLGSVATGTLQRADLPVLVIRPAVLAAAAAAA
jgi:nucleotide-binding universal stress UspA family protein